MSLNVVNEFIKFKKKTLNSYAKLCLDKYYDKKIFDELLDHYIKIRYYDELDLMTSKSFIKKINNQLIEKAKEIVIDSKNNNIEHLLYFFVFVYQLDGLIKLDVNLLVDKINKYRKDTLHLEKLDVRTTVNLFNTNIKREEIYLLEFEDENFYLDIKEIEKNLFDVVISHNVKIPKLYSKYAIDTVFNRDIVLENKLFIEYYMTSAKIIEDVIKLNFTKKYMVEFCSNIISKKEKLSRLINIINDEIIKERLLIKINYSTYLENKLLVDNYITEGFKFCLIVDKEVEEKEKILFKIFSYVIYN